ncbi:MAG: HEAT repeat domain-containing protein, partial [Phycisphaerae bacterium]
MPVLLILPVLWCIGLTVLPGALGQIDDNSTYVDAEALAEQLNLAREGIIDPDARPDDRRRWIDALFSFNTPQAQVLVVELLEYGENPAAQQALCEGIARHVRSHPERLDSSFVDPLIELLGSNSQDVRSAASRALADFPGDEVIKKLGSLAGRSDVAIDKRLAAIDAMISKVDRRTVVHELMLLLETGVPEVTERVVAALEPVSREPLGADVERWRLWWAKKAELDEEAWLADRLSLYRDRMQHLERELKRVRERATRRHDAITAKTAELLREVFRGLGTDQQQAKLAEWLEDPLTEIILVSLDLIKAKMADEGQRPEGKVLQALIRLLDSEEATVRLSVLEIVQNLKNEPSVAQAVLGRMANETEPEVQHLLIRALGKLDVPEAFPTLIIHIADPHSPPDCVREAAIALGRIASKGCKSDQLEDAIG